MFKSISFLFAMAVLMMAAPMAVLAQDDSGKSAETYLADFYTITYPSTFVLEETDTAVQIASTPDAFEALAADAVNPAFEAGVAVLQLELFAKADVDGDLTQQRYDELAALDDIEIGELAVADDYSAYAAQAFDYRAANVDARVWVIESESAYVIATAIVSSGERDLSLNALLTMLDTLVIDDAAVAADGTATSTPAPDVTADSLAYGDVVEGVIAGGGRVLYTFEGTQGDVVVIDAVAATGARLDLVLELIGPNAVILQRDDDSGGGLNPRIDFVLPTSGTFQIAVSTFFGAQDGEYTLALNAGVEALGDVEGTLSIGDTVDAYLPARSQQVYTFEGTQGQGVVIAATAEAGSRIDLVLELRGPNGVTIQRNDDGGGGFNPLINVIALPQTGTYTIVVSTFSGFGDGNYALSLTAN